MLQRSSETLRSLPGTQPKSSSSLRHSDTASSRRLHRFCDKVHRFCDTAPKSSCCALLRACAPGRVHRLLGTAQRVHCFCDKVHRFCDKVHCFCDTVTQHPAKASESSRLRAPPARPLPAFLRGCSATADQSRTAGLASKRSRPPQCHVPGHWGGLPSAPVRSSAPHASGTQAISKHSQRVKCIADWKDLLEQVGTCSAMYVTAITSKSPEAAYEAFLRDFTPSTLAQYFRCIRVFLAFARALDVSVGDLQLVHIVDLMHACDTSHTEDRTSVRISPKPMLKALSWLARIGQIHSLIAPLANQLVRASSPQQNRERKEALPLPLAVFAAWEQKVCSADCTTGLRIALGSFLLAAHTSMRFGDIQRIRVQDISLTQHVLRGSCWATKTTKSGQPWACTIFGLAGRDEKSSWVLFWLRSLSISVTHSATSAPDLPSPDFVLPALASITQDAPASFQSPMAYTQALAMLRWAVQLPWMPRTASHLNHDEAQAYTLHSLKVALLGAAAQLRLPEESRRQQGHHRLTSVQLYSRDDTIESLWVQSQIASALIRGWRPTRPQSRGGQRAVFEPAFSVGAGPIPTSITLHALPSELLLTGIAESSTAWSRRPVTL